MSTTVVLGVADQEVAAVLRSQLEELGDVEVAVVAESPAELLAAVVAVGPAVVLVHDRLGPGDVLRTVKDVALRRPAAAPLLVTSGPSGAADAAAAMEAGARGLVAHPPALEELGARVRAAADWSQRMTLLLGGAREAEVGDLGRVVALAGAKGGVGTTTVATHLALALRAAAPARRVCVVDLDLEKGDVPSLLDVRQRVSVADVAKVADDMSARTVEDAVVVHASGVHLLCAPQDVREVELVTPRAVRSVLTILREQYDVVLVDAGSHVTPVQAAAVEVADEVVAVVTPDVCALRSLRRELAAWTALGVRVEQDVCVLVNRASRQDVLPSGAVQRLTGARVLDVVLPAAFRALEAGLVDRDPRSVRSSGWSRELGRLGPALGLAEDEASGRRARGRARRGGTGGTSAGVPASAVQEADADGAGAPSSAGGGADGSRRRAVREAGQATVEMVGVLPVLLLVVVLAWQLVVTAMVFVSAGHASAVAARELGVTSSCSAAQAAARDEGTFTGRARVSCSGSGDGARVRTELPVPLLAPGLVDLPASIGSTSAVVVEP